MNLVKYKNVLVREGLGVDKDMVKQCLDNYKSFDNLEGAVVMDWGMNVGGFGAMMLDKPIKQYIGIECHPENFEVAKANLGHDKRFTLINAAVTSLDLPCIDLWLTNSKQNFCSGTINLKSDAAKSMRKNRISVPTIHVDELMSRYAPTHLKCDIEGEEYRIFDYWNWFVPGHIQQLALEYHWADKILKYETTIREEFLSQDLTPIYERINYVKGDTPWVFLGQDYSYRNIWGMDAFYKRT